MCYLTFAIQVRDNTPSKEEEARTECELGADPFEHFRKVYYE